MWLHLFLQRQDITKIKLLAAIAEVGESKNISFTLMVFQMQIFDNYNLKFK